MTKKAETVASMSKRVGNAIQSKEVDILKDEVDAIVKADERVHRTTAVSDAPIGHRK